MTAADGFFRLDGKTAAVFGGASGIGEAIAGAFSRQGAAVVVCDIDGTGARAVASATRSEACTVDVARWAEVRECVESIAARHGRIDLLVNCAAVMHVGKLHETEPEDFERVQSVNVLGTYHTCRAAIPHMLERRSGTIVNLASVAALIAVERRLAYCTSKGAVLEMTRAIAIDYARDGIRANAICPGTVDTPMIRGYVQKYFSATADRTWRELNERQPVGRLGSPAEIASLAVYLASDASAFMTGAAIPIDGGWTAK